jgi:rSAM/selenodomain-associated transferase 2
MSRPWLSIILPVLNEAPTLVEALHRLESWRAAGAEVIVVDGGSTDQSRELAAAGADRVLAAPRGRATQMNAGAAASAADLLLFLHADTALPAAAQAALRALPQAPCWGRFDVELDAPGLALRVVAAMMNWRSRLTGIATGDQAIFVSRGLFERCGAYPPIPLMEDIALSAQLRRLCKPACLRPRVRTSARRWVQGGVLRTVLLMWGLRLAYFMGVAPARLAVWYRQVR